MSSQHGQQHSLEAENKRKINLESAVKSDVAGPATTYHTLIRTWAMQANTASEGAPTERSDAMVAPAIQQWMEEPMRQQSWNAIGSFATTSSSKERHRAEGEMRSNSAMAGTDELQTYM